MRSPVEVLDRIRESAPGDVCRVAELWLGREGTESVGKIPAEVTVGEVASVWRLRAANLQEKGKALIGAEHLLVRLGELNSHKKLLQFSFENLEWTGSAFFEKANGQFVGVAAKPLSYGLPNVADQERAVHVA